MQARYHIAITWWRAFFFAAGGKMEYPINLINSYRNHEITRDEFEKSLAAMQGFNNTVGGYFNPSGSFITYRGRAAKIKGNTLEWLESNGEPKKANSIREFKIKIDILETRVRALVLKSCYWANAAYEASRRAEYEKREQYQREQLKILEALKRILNY